MKNYISFLRIVGLSFFGELFNSVNYFGIFKPEVE